MAFHNEKASRQLASQRKSCKQRRVEQRLRVKCLIPRSHFLVFPGIGSLHQQTRSKHVCQKDQVSESDEDDILGPDEVVITDEDIRSIRDSVDKMQQQLSRGIQDIEEIRAMVKEAAVQDEREMIARRAKLNDSSSIQR
uniref:Uncharacterized protein n=1 Tax=Hyaloperonospora arabidopsidis (strain Emoy2) TaxID=559515 RepID=M4C1W1_HYAAE